VKLKEHQVLEVNAQPSHLNSNEGSEDESRFLSTKRDQFGDFARNKEMSTSMMNDYRN